MKQVRNGLRILQFEGDLLAESSSWRPGVNRWVEFQLYRTVTSGTYVLSRTGVSLLYHRPDCVVVKRNKLNERPYSDLAEFSEPCMECRPDRMDFPLICPETPRYWAQQCDNAEAVRESLMKYDTAGNRYMTLVAQRLLEDASEKDESIAAAYRIETIS